jgi:hypothetical protein
MAANERPATPEQGEASTVQDWLGQTVERDTELAEERSELLPPEEAERVFELQARRGPRFDSEPGEAAHRDNAG